jgi:hypothetical protein
MTVFYCIHADGLRHIDFIRYLSNIVLEDADISYWAVPGTLYLED